MLKKLKRFSFSIKFKRPNQKDIVIFDNEGSGDILKYVIEDSYDYIIYDTLKINIYLNIYFFVKFFKNLF